MRPESFELAARALTGLTGCSLAQGRRAADATWKIYGAWHETDVFGWLVLLHPQVKRLMKPKLRLVRDGAP